jgi:hypothetical protein
VDTRFFGATHTQTAPHVVSSFIELESEDGAKSALDWLETDSRKPCPMSWAVQISTFEVDDVADARGVRRIATTEDIERVGTEDQQPFDSYWVGFATVHSSTRWICMGLQDRCPRSKLRRPQASITTGLLATSGAAVRCTA